MMFLRVYDLYDVPSLFLIGVPATPAICLFSSGKRVPRAHIPKEEDEQTKLAALFCMVQNHFSFLSEFRMFVKKTSGALVTLIRRIHFFCIPSPYGSI